MVTSEYENRIRRAHRLATLQTSAKPALVFYTCLAEFHKGLYAQLAAMPLSERPLSSGDLRSELDLASLLQHFPEFLSVSQLNAPEQVVEAARQTALEGPAAWITLLTEYWSVAGRPAEDSGVFSGEPEPGSDALAEFIARAFLQPYAEFLSRNRQASESVETGAGCPVCGSAPMIVVLRDSGPVTVVRALVCSLCLHEWRSNGQQRCLHCDQPDAKVSNHFFDEMAPVFVEACDACRTYLPCVDMKKAREAVPVVDDIAAVEPTRWAQEHNYRRACANVLGT